MVWWWYASSSCCGDNVSLVGGPTCVHVKQEDFGHHSVALPVKCLHMVIPSILCIDAVEPQRTICQQLTASVMAHGHIALLGDHQVEVSPPHVLDELKVCLC